MPNGTSLTRASNAGGVWQKSRFCANIWLHHVLWTLRAPSAMHLAATDHGELMTLMAGKRQSLLMAGDTMKCMTWSLNVTPKTTEQHSIVRSGKSEAEVGLTIIKDCVPGIILLKLTTDGHRASRGLSATAELLVLSVVEFASCCTCVLKMRRYIYVARYCCWSSVVVSLLRHLLRCCGVSYHCSITGQEAQMSQRDRAMLHIIEHFVKPLKIIRNDTIE